MQGAAPSINLLRLECESPLPLGYLIQLVWPLTAQATCLRRSSARSTVVPAPAVSINLLRPGCEAPFSRICQAVWLLTARTICLSDSLAAFLRLVRAGYEPPLPPDQLELWLSSETLRQQLQLSETFPPAPLFKRART